MEVAGSQVWFTDLWNYSIVPYLVEAVKEGNGEAAWEDPAQFITSSYPWIATHAVHGGSDAIRRLRPEDVGYDVVSSGHNSGVGASSVRSLGSTHSDTEGDPLVKTSVHKISLSFSCLIVIKASRSSNLTNRVLLFE